MHHIVHILIYAIISWTWLAAQANAHGIPDMCDVRTNIVAQCGEFHSCEINEEIDASIGVCTGEFETERFEVCDQRRGDEDCPETFSCKTGTISPTIGACLENKDPNYGRLEPVEEPADKTSNAACHVSTIDTIPHPSLFLFLLSVLGLLLSKSTRHIRCLR